MNDDFDARLYYDKKRIEKWLKSFLIGDGMLKVVEEFITMEQLPREIVNIIPNAKYFLDWLKKIPKTCIRDISNSLIQDLLLNLDTELEKITEIVQQKTKFACFTQKIYSDMMWGQYSDNATGFALEYELGNKATVNYKGSNENTCVRGNLFPVMYDNQRLDTTTYVVYLFQIRVFQEMAQKVGIGYDSELLDKIVPCPDEFMVTKLAIKKSTDWKAEKEWRMFYTTNDPLLSGQEYSCVIQKPSGIYLGRKISKINQKIIVDMAKEKAIPVCKMNFNENSRKYKLKNYRII